MEKESEHQVKGQHIRVIYLRFTVSLGCRNFNICFVELTVWFYSVKMVEGLGNRPLTTKTGHVCLQTVKYCILNSENKSILVPHKRVR